MADFTGSVVSRRGQTNKAPDRPEDVQYAQIMRLMTSAHTHELHERHAFAVKKVCRLCAGGYLLEHLEQLIALFALVMDRYEQGKSVFGPCIVQIVQTGCLPFVSRRASDMVTFGGMLPQFLIVLMRAFPLAAPDPDLPPDEQHVRERIRVETAHMLACWARHGLDASSIDPSEPLSVFAQQGTPNLRIIDQSTAVDAVAGAFRVEDSQECVIVLLGAIRDMSLYSPLASKISNSGLLSHLVHVIHLHMMGSDILLVAVEILWNILELDWEGASRALGSLDLMELFREFMHMVLTDGYRERDKALRNDLLVLISMIAERREVQRLFADSGLLHVLLQSALAPSVARSLRSTGALGELMGTVSTAASGKNPQGDAPLPLGNNPQDMEYRILVWKCLSKCCEDGRCAEVAEQFQLVASLVSYLDPDGSELQKWSREQIRTLQIQALDALFRVSQHMPDEMANANGWRCVLKLIQAAGADEGLLRKALLLMHVLRLDGMDEHGLTVLLSTFHEAGTMGIRQLCACVLAQVCADNKVLQRAFRKQGGVDALCKYIEYKPEEALENFLSFEVCIIDAVWSCIVGNPKCEQRFLDKDGLFKLLEVLEVAPMMLKRQILGCVADLVENPRAARMFVQWNSDVTMKGGLKLLLGFWAQEQQRRGAVDDQGVLVNPDFPLHPPLDDVAADDRDATKENLLNTVLSKTSQKSTVQQGPTAHLASRDMLTEVFEFEEQVREVQDVRAKLYAILAKAGFEGHEALLIAERQHMELLKLYPECRVLEQLLEVEARIQSKGLKPLAMDQANFDALIQEHRTRTQWVQNVQAQLNEEQMAEEQYSLDRFYNAIRARAKAGASGEKTGALE